MENRTYYYARVSTKEQNLDRQLNAFRQLGATERDIVTDKESGKSLDRSGYPKGTARGAGKTSGRNRRAESTADRGTGGFEEAAGHPLLGTESHTRHRGKQRAAQEAAHQRSLAG